MGRTYQQDQEVLKASTSVNFGLTGANRDMKTVLEAVDTTLGDPVYIENYSTQLASVTGQVQVCEAAVTTIQTQNQTWDGIKSFTEGIRFGASDTVLARYEDTVSFTPSVRANSGTELITTVRYGYACRIGNMLFFNTAFDIGYREQTNMAIVFLQGLTLPSVASPCFVWGGRDLGAGGGKNWSGRVSNYLKPPGDVVPDDLCAGVTIYDYLLNRQLYINEISYVDYGDNECRTIVVCGCYFTYQFE